MISDGHTVTEVAALEARRRHPGWGPRRIVHVLAETEITVSEWDSVVRAACPRISCLLIVGTCLRHSVVAWSQASAA